MESFHKCSDTMTLNNDGSSVKSTKGSDGLYNSAYGTLELCNKFDHEWLFHIVSTRNVGGCTGCALGISDVNIKTLNFNKNNAKTSSNSKNPNSYSLLLYSGIKSVCGKSTLRVFPKWQNGKLSNGDKIRMKFFKLSKNKKNSNNNYALSFEIMNGANKCEEQIVHLIDFRDSVIFHMFVTMYFQNDEIELMQYERFKHLSCSSDHSEKQTMKNQLHKEEINLSLMKQQMNLNELEITKMQTKESIANETMKMSVGICELSKLLLGSPLLLKSDAVMSLQELHKFRVQVQEFGDLLLEREKQLKSLLDPDIAEYQEWNLDQMIRWISSLDDGRYRKYCDHLTNAFRSDGIENGSVMVRLAINDLERAPFNINSLADREQLESHFLKLKENNQNKHEE